MPKFSVAALILVIAAAGCVSSENIISLSDGTLEMKASADPETVFTDRTATVYVDAENKDVKTLHNVNIEVFETGLAKMEDKEKCSEFLDAMLPNKTFSLRCDIRAPSSIIEDIVDNAVHVKATYKTKLSIVQSLDFLSESWYERLKLTGIALKPKKYVYGDKNVKAAIEFSDNMPLVIRKERKYYMYLTLENIGNGIMKEINAGDIEMKLISEGKERISDCSVRGVIYSVGKKFPRIACEILPPDVETQRTEDLILGINYNYEVRASAVVKIKK